ncbi:glycosyltransferase family 4 protein [Nocardia nepalensis]|uniref:glycosyltransferase family 4 protein n=1 Tax=Nocardia nepalensis TaxID=3375448 RepID=UPI003B66F70E
MLTPNLLFMLDSPNVERGYALAGTPARVLSLAEHSRRVGAQVTVLLCDRGNDYGTAADWPVEVVLVHPNDYYNPAAVAGVLDAEVDIVAVCEAQTLIAVGRPLADLLHAHLLYDVHDDDAALARSLNEPPDAVACAAQLQQGALDLADLVIACAQRELMLALRAGVPGERVELIPNGADSDSFCWGSVCNTQRLVFVGNLFYRPNQIAVQHLRDHIVPSLRELRPCARVQVIGRGPAEVTRETDGLEFCGPAASLGVALRNATLGLAPLTAGAGSKLKVVNYMAAGLPVLATSEAASGLPPDHRGVVIEDDLDQWAARISALLDDPILLHELGSAGRDVVDEELSWQHIATQLVRCCQGWMDIPTRAMSPVDLGPMAVARWKTEHAVQGALGTPRHTKPGHAVHLTRQRVQSGPR